MPRVIDPMQRGRAIDFSGGLFERVPTVTPPKSFDAQRAESLRGLDVCEVTMDDWEDAVGWPHQWAETVRGGL